MYHCVLSSSHDLWDNIITLLQIFYTQKCSFALLYNTITWYSNQGHFRQYPNPGSGQIQKKCYNTSQWNYTHFIIHIDCGRCIIGGGAFTISTSNIFLFLLSRSISISSVLNLLGCTVEGASLLSWLCCVRMRNHWRYLSYGSSSCWCWCRLPAPTYDFM